MHHVLFVLVPAVAKPHVYKKALILTGVIIF